MQRWRNSQFLQVTAGAFAIALGITAAVVFVAALLVGCAVLGDVIAEAVR